MQGIQESDRHQHIGIPEKLIKEPDSGKEKEQIMEFIAECKLMGDGYAGGFSCGMSMAGSQTTENLVKIKTSGEKNKKVTLWKDERGYEVRVFEEKENQVARVYTEFKNNSEKEVVMEMLASFALKGIKADKIHRLQSFWSAEGRLRTETIEELHLEKSWNGCARRIEKFGNVGSMPVRKYFPFLALEDCETEEFTGILMGHASSWQIEISCKEVQELDVMGGIADRDFGQWMKRVLPGESFTTPDALIARGNSLADVCDKLIKAQRLNISPVDADMGIMFNEYCTSWGNPTIDSIKKLSDRLVGQGVKYLVIDSGWYGLPNDWACSVGNWEINKDRFPNGLKEAADYIRSRGMIPGLWFEMEVAGPHSRYFHETEHLLSKDGYPLTVSGRRFLDMEDPWVIEQLTRDVIGTLKECGFGYLKIDYNDTIGMGCDGADSLGDALYRKVKATQQFIRKIKEEIPDIVIENCSSGGHRLVYSMMELVSQASFSDAHETLAIPVIAANMHRVIQPAQSQIWAVLRAKDDADRLTYSLTSTFLGRMCLSGDIYDLTAQQLSLVEEAISFYRKAAEVIRSGKTTRIECSTESYNHPEGQQLVIREYEGKRLIIFHRFRNSAELPDHILRDSRIIAEFGRADKDFTAAAYLVENGRTS